MRKCNCSGNCGPQPLNRREFIGLVGAGAAATLLGNTAWGAFELPADDLQRWRRDLFAPAQPRLYLSDKHTDARMHLGGIGTGNFEIGVDGQLTTWQLFNTLRDGQVPFHFLIRAGATAKLLQTAGGPDWPRVKQIEMTGEYPVAVLRFRDADLPVQVELTSFSPLAPLDTRLSSMPLAAFVFRVKNPTKQKQTVSLAALMQNPVGYDAAGDNNSATNPSFGGNVNEVWQEGEAGGLFMRAEAGGEPALDTPVTIWTTANLKSLNAPPPDRPKNLTVDILDAQPPRADKLADPAHTVIWLEEAGPETPESLVRAAQEAVQAGATLLFSGKSMPLLQGYALWTEGKPVAEVSQRPDILFEDFEHGYDKWKVEGEAFGKEPAQGTLPHQNPVSGFLGKGLVNTFVGGDDTTGRLISQPFTIERRFIRFLVGGGRYGNTQIRLVVDGKVVRATSGKDSEELQPAMWEVSRLQGQTARIEIVDDRQGGWGHVNVDQIEFSDTPGNRAVMQLLEDLLPARFSRIRPAGDPADGTTAVEIDNLVLQPGVTRSRASHGPKLLTREVGKGKVVLAAGSVLEPARAAFSHHRQAAYSFICWLVGANYTGGVGFQHPKAPGFGTLALAALARDTTVLPAAGHRDDAWKAFAADGRFTPLATRLFQPPDAARPHRLWRGGRHGFSSCGKDHRSPLPARLALSQQIQRGPNLDGLPLRHPMARRPGRPARSRARFRHAAREDRTVPPDLLRQHAALLDARLRHRQCRHLAAYRSRVPHRQRRHLRLGRLEWLLSADLHACLGL